MKAIKIRCSGSRNVDVDELVEFQGGLKDLPQENFERLKKEIIETGFAFPIYVWKKGADECIIAGHQRVRTLKTLRRLGYSVPAIPVVDIVADSEREAKRRVLQDASQYGVVNEDGFAEFLHASEFDLDFARDSFRLPDIKWDKFFEGNAVEVSGSEKGRSASEEVKSVVLKFDSDTHEKFLKFVDVLAHKYDTKSVTDTVFKALESDFHS
jgi:hypothetical protein